MRIQGRFDCGVCVCSRARDDTATHRIRIRIGFIDCIHAHRHAAGIADRTIHIGFDIFGYQVIVAVICHTRQYFCNRTAHRHRSASNTIRRGQGVIIHQRLDRDRSISIQSAATDIRLHTRGRRRIGIRPHAADQVAARR